MLDDAVLPPRRRGPCDTAAPGCAPAPRPESPGWSRPPARPTGTPPASDRSDAGGAAPFATQSDERDEQRAQREALVHHVAAVRRRARVARGRRGRERRGARVLGGRDHVTAARSAVNGRSCRPSTVVCVSDAARPQVLVAAVHVEHLRHVPQRLGMRDERAAGAGLRVGLLDAREREDVGRIEERRVRLRVARRLREPVIEAAAARAGRVREEAVVRLPPLLVRVEALVQEVPQEPAGLGHAVGDAVLRRRRAGRIVLQKRDDVPHGRHAGADDHRAGRAIHRLVDPAGLEARPPCRSIADRRRPCRPPPPARTATPRAARRGARRSGCRAPSARSPDPPDPRPGSPRPARRPRCGRATSSSSAHRSSASLRTRPVIGCAASPAGGGVKFSALGPFGTSHCQPTATTVTPRWKRKPSP